MTNFSYNRDIPDGPNNPSNDQPLMKVNTNSTDDLIAVDHYSFGVNNGGLHKQVQLPELLAVPGGLIANSETVYSKAVNSTGQLFFTRGSAGTEIALTSGVNGDVINAANGSTFLAGGLLIQWGTSAVVSGAGSVSFNTAFSANAYSVSITSVRSATNVDTVYFVSSNSSGFNYFNTSGGGIASIKWIAIGPKN